jgi:hypothetical protein
VRHHAAADGADHRVQAGTVAATGEDAYTHAAIVCANLQFALMDDWRVARRDSMIAGVLVGIAAALLAHWASGVLIVFGIAAIVIGVVISLTVIGAIIGIPLIIVGFLALLAGIVTGIGGVAVAVLVGVASGYTYYRLRMRSLLRHAGAHPGRLSR